MECKEAWDRLHDHVSGEVVDPDLEAHLISCADCVSRFKAWRGFRENVGRVGRSQPVPAGLRDRVQNEIANHGSTFANSFLSARRLLPALVALAAAVALILGLTTLLRAPNSPSHDVAVSSPSPHAETPRSVAMGAQPLDRLDRQMRDMLEDHEYHGNNLDPADKMTLQEQEKYIRTFKSELGGALEIPAHLGISYAREQCRWCPMSKRSVPHIHYRDGKKSVSLYVASASEVQLPAAAHDGQFFSRRERNESVLAWRSGHIVYVLISLQSQKTLMELASAFGQRGG